MRRFRASLLVKAPQLSWVNGTVEQAQDNLDRRRRREAALIGHLTSAGYMRTEPAILQPAASFLELAGEELRHRIFTTSDPAGVEYCLRPEFTIPVCRAYLDSPGAGEPAAFSYIGKVFRYRAEGPSEFVQAGLESFGRADREAADAEVMTLALEAAGAGGAGDLKVKLGDAGLFNALLAALKIDDVWMRRIRRGIARGQSLETIFAPPSDGAGVDHSGVLAALQGVDRKGARALVEDLLSIAGISSVSGRSAGEIAERFLEQATLRDGEGFSAEKRAVIEQYFAIAGDPDDAASRLRKLAADARLDLGASLDEFESRVGFIAARGFDVAQIDFATAFARNLDYYTGFIFEAHCASDAARGPVVGGGRYDNLLTALGAASPVPAVGAAIWCDRLANAETA